MSCFCAVAENSLSCQLILRVNLLVCEVKLSHFNPPVLLYLDLFSCLFVNVNVILLPSLRKLTVKIEEKNNIT